MKHMTSTDKYPAYVSIVASQRAQSHACTLYFATFTLGSKSGNQRTISSPMMTHKRNGSTKAAEMKSINTLGREEKGSRIPQRHSKVRGREAGVSRCGKHISSSMIITLASPSQDAERNSAPMKPQITRNRD